MKKIKSNKDSKKTNHHKQRIRKAKNHPHLLQITSRSYYVYYTSSHSFLFLSATYTSSHSRAPLWASRMPSTENHVGAHSSLYRCVCNLHLLTKIIACATCSRPAQLEPDFRLIGLSKICCGHNSIWKDIYCNHVVQVGTKLFIGSVRGCHVQRCDPVARLTLTCTRGRLSLPASAPTETELNTIVTATTNWRRGRGQHSP
jgi:hypothetical protein